MKLTPWYPRDVNPVHKGVYEIKNNLGMRWFRYWDGESWYEGSWYPASAVWNKKKAYYREPWRGLTKKAK